MSVALTIVKKGGALVRRQAVALIRRAGPTAGTTVRELPQAPINPAGRALWRRLGLLGAGALATATISELVDQALGPDTPSREEIERMLREAGATPGTRIADATEATERALAMGLSEVERAAFRAHRELSIAVADALGRLARAFDTDVAGALRIATDLATVSVADSEIIIEAIGARYGGELAGRSDVARLAAALEGARIVAILPNALESALDSDLLSSAGTSDVAEPPPPAATPPVSPVPPSATEEP